VRRRLGHDYRGGRRLLVTTTLGRTLTGGAGPLIVIRSTLVLFDVIEPGSALDIVVVPEIIWEAGLGFYP
jgi:hypothetical protein